MNLPRIVAAFVLGILVLGCSHSEGRRPTIPASAAPFDPLPDDKKPDDKKTDEPMPKDQVEHARAFIALMVKEDFKGAAKDFDATMVRVYPIETFEKNWKDIIAAAGPFKKQGLAVREKQDKYEIVVVTCEFENRALAVRVVYDPDGKIGGLQFRPPKSADDDKPPAYAKKDSFRETEVTVTTGEWSLPGTLTLPKGDGPFPTVVLVHGSGPNDRDETIGPNKMFRDLAWGLASQGIAALRYDKRTFVMRSKVTKAPEGITVKEETIDDAVSAVELLGRQKEIDKKRIFIVGHSLGAFVAPRIAEAAPNVAGLVVLAGNTRPLEDLVLEQIIYVLPLQGVSEEKQKETIEKLKKQVERVKDPKLAADTPAADLPLGIVPACYWLDLRKYDPAATAAKLKQPMFILQGERDYQVTMADFDGWKKAVGERKNVRLKSYPKLNHLFMEGEGKAKPMEYEKPGHVAAETIDDIAEWIKKQ